MYKLLIFLSCISFLALQGTELSPFPLTKFMPRQKDIKMPAGWEDKEISHTSWASGKNLAIALDQHLFTALKPLIEEFSLKNKIKVGLKEGTCGISAGLLRKKQTDIAGFCCPPGKMDRFPGIKYHTLGISPLTVLVHKKNPLSELHLNQVRSLFAGKIKNWQELHPSFRGSVQPITRLHCKKRPGHWRLILDNENQFSHQMSEVGAIPDMMAMVARNPYAIGYESYWNVLRYGYQKKVKVLQIDNVSPFSKESLAKRKYPLYRVYNITTWQSKKSYKPMAAKLVSFLLKHVNKIDGKFGIVPSSLLKKSGWVFNENELVGEPK